MYFLTNKEGYIIAASNDFLSTIGSREICSISSMLHNQLIVVEDNKLKIPNKSLKYDCSISSMYSALGELKLYSLKEIKEEDESIAYLKQIKSGKIAKEDNEYAIPDIPILHKSKEELEEPTLKIVEEIKEESTPKEPIAPKEQESIVSIEEETPTTEIKVEEPTAKESANQEIKIEEEKELIKDDVASKEQVEIKIEEPTQEPTKPEKEIREETSDSYNLKLIEEIEKIAVSTPATKQEGEISKESIEKLADEIVKEQESKELDTINIFNNIDNTQTKESIDKVTTNPQELEQSKDEQHLDIKENIIKIEPTTLEEEPSKEESEFKKITKRLFPWGRKDEDIELEEKDFEIDIKPAKELEEKQQEETKEDTTPVIDKTKEIEVIEEERVKEEIEEERVIDDTNIRKTQEDRDTTNEVLNIVKEIPTTTEPVETVLKESTLETKVDASQTEQKTIQEQKEDIKDNKIVYKLIKLQVNSIDLEANAHKLSIDPSSYEMLVENYLDEIEKYKNDLQNRLSSTINMLADAGELLSLNIITKKLIELKEAQNRPNTIKEIELISSLLKEKLESKKNIQEELEPSTQDKTPVIETKPYEEEIEVKEKEVLPKEVVDITTADALLNKITKENVTFDPQRAADELNLPKRLIVEFVHDFISQSKEHLPVIVDAYKSNNIQTIQTTAHMLKGAASNLRLDSIAENLFKIQKENSLDRSGELIKDFVAKLKGLEEAVASMEDAENED